MTDVVEDVRISHRFAPTVLYLGNHKCFFCLGCNGLFFFKICIGIPQLIHGKDAVPEYSEFRLATNLGYNGLAGCCWLVTYMVQRGVTVKGGGVNNRVDINQALAATHEDGESNYPARHLTGRADWPPNQGNAISIHSPVHLRDEFK